MAAAAALASAMLLIAGLVAIATGLRDGDNEQAEVTELVEAIAAESAAVTNGYFAGPESVAQVAAATLEDDPGDEVIIDLLRNLTASQPNVAGTFIGYPDGSFTDVRRDETSPGAFREKTIELIAGERVVEVRIVDPTLETLDEFTLPDDTFDPRFRSWYAGAETEQSYWTEPYTFFTSQELGITHSVPVFDESGSLLAVVGVDIALTDLQDFLAGRQPSLNGGAAVLSSLGELVAGDTQLLGDPGGDAAIQRLLAETASTDPGEAIRTERVEGDLARVVVGTRVGQGGTQLLIVDAPDDDFLQGIRSTRRNFALLATALGIVGILLVAFGAALIGRYLGTLGHMARTDPLTGLLNRSALQEKMSTALEAGSDVAIMTTDLDNFKLVNDQFGHEAGDRALTRVAEQLQAATPANAFVGRLGGDEFCIALIDDPDPAETLRSVVTTAAGTVDAPEYSFDLELSAGYSLSSSNEPKTPEVLFRHADVALYQAKSQRGTSLVQFDETMHMRWHHDDERKVALMKAIDNGEIEMHFQPELDLRNNVVVGAEGLLRWNDPERGLLAGAEFIEDLKRFDLMARLQPALFAEATRLAKSVPTDAEFTIRMNISDEQLLVPDLLDHIKRAVDTTSTHWCLEINEPVMVDATPQVLTVLRVVRRLGARIALDNYGTGYSSLAQLQTLPLDEIKIPRVFVQALADTHPQSSIAAVLVELAAATGLDATVTGIENDRQRNALVEAGIRHGQGYLLGEPVPVEEFIATWYDQQRRAA